MKLCRPRHNYILIKINNYLVTLINLCPSLFRMLRFVIVSQNCRNMLIKSVQGVAPVKASFPYPLIGKLVLLCFGEYH